MAEATTYQNPSTEKAEMRATIKSWLAEMDRLHIENKQSQERIEYMGQDIDARLANLDTILARLAAA